MDSIFSVISIIKSDVLVQEKYSLNTLNSEKLRVRIKLVDNSGWRTICYISAALCLYCCVCVSRCVYVCVVVVRREAKASGEEFPELWNALFLKVWSTVTPKGTGRCLGCSQQELESQTRDLLGTTMLLLLCLRIGLNSFHTLCVSCPNLCRCQVLGRLIALSVPPVLLRCLVRFCLTAQLALQGYSLTVANSDRCDNNHLIGSAPHQYREGLLIKLNAK